MPALNLQAAGEYKGGKQWLLRKGLIVFQFTVSLVFIIGSIVIAQQLQYTRDVNPGFNADAILTIESPRGDSLSKIGVLAEKIKKIPAEKSNVSINIPLAFETGINFYRDIRQLSWLNPASRSKTTGCQDCPR